MSSESFSSGDNIRSDGSNNNGSDSIRSGWSDKLVKTLIGIQAPALRRFATFLLTKRNILLTPEQWVDVYRLFYNHNAPAGAWESGSCQKTLSGQIDKQKAV